MPGPFSVYLVLSLPKPDLEGLARPRVWAPVASKKAGLQWGSYKGICLHGPALKGLVRLRVAHLQRSSAVQPQLPLALQQSSKPSQQFSSLQRYLTAMLASQSVASQPDWHRTFHPVDQVKSCCQATSPESATISWSLKPMR